MGDELLDRLGELDGLTLYGHQALLGALAALVDAQTWRRAVDGLPQRYWLRNDSGVSIQTNTLTSDP